MLNRAELLSLSYRAPTFPQASSFNDLYQASATLTGSVVFENYTVSDCYWTLTTDAADTTLAWAICSRDFGVYDIAKSDLRYLLAVRQRIQRRTPRYPAYVATSASTAQPRITAA